MQENGKAIICLQNNSLVWTFHEAWLERKVQERESGNWRNERPKALTGLVSH